MVGPTLELVRHEELSGMHLDGLRRLFDGEYARDFGDWDPEQPYGYAPHDIHVIARDHRGIVGHVGWARRTIVVGARHVVIAGVGGVIVAGRARGSRLGSILMDVTAGSIADARGIDYGYLGCREAVVPFYVACGWVRIVAAERSIDRHGRAVCDEPGQPLLILPIEQNLARWPDGEIDLCGRAW